MRTTTTIVAVAAAVLLTAVVAKESRADFSLHGDEQLTVNDASNPYGTLFDRSVARIISGGSMASLSAYNSSTVNMSGGQANYFVAWNRSAVNMSGGQVNSIYAYDSSILTFDARFLQLGDGLSRDRNRVWGSGQLSGEWLDGTAWTTSIYAVPEPASMAVLALGGVAMLRRRRR
jgi:hypothetical protein